MDNSENLSEYADPEIYDLENQDFTPDGQFFLDYAKKVSGSVLELGCGSGRVTIPLAQNEVPITGLDIVPAMIEKAKQKAGGLPIQWVVDDIRSFHLDQKYPLIFETGSVFHHLLTRLDQEQYLARVREHLDDEVSLSFASYSHTPNYWSQMKWRRNGFGMKERMGKS